MSWLRVGALAAVVGAAAACSKDAGAILVLGNPSGMPVARVEVVLASASGDNGEDTIITVKQRVAVMAKVEEDVRYYKQESTSKVVDLGGKDANDFTVILQQPAGAPAGKKYIPFVFAYDDANALVGVGRVTMGDADDTPAAITIPEGELQQFPIALEPMTPPDLVETGVARDTGTVVTCAKDDVVRGAAWKFAKGIQMRIVFAKPGETNGIPNPYDLDCDDHVVDASAAQMDCNDLRDVTYPGAPEVCGDDDRNCDMQPPADQTPCTLVNPDPDRAEHWGTCAGLTPCPGQGGTATCLPDPSNAADDACFCLAPNACTTQVKCELEVTLPAMGPVGATDAYCTPEVSDMPLQNPCEAAGPTSASGVACTVSVLRAPAGLTAELGSISDSGTVTFQTTPILLNGMPATPQDHYVLRATWDAAAVPATPPDDLGDLVLLATPPAPATPTRYFIHLVTKAAGGNGCTVAVVPGVDNGDHVDVMQCTRTN